MDTMQYLSIANYNWNLEYNKAGVRLIEEKVETVDGRRRWEGERKVKNGRRWNPADKWVIRLTVSMAMVEGNILTSLILHCF